MDSETLIENGFFEKVVSGLDPKDKKTFISFISRQNREKALLKTIFNNLRDGIVVIDRKSRILYSNDAAKSLLGLPENAENNKITRFLREIEIEKLLVTDEDEWFAISRQEIEVFYPVHRFLLFYLLPHETEKGTAVIMLHDITESRLKTEKQIEDEKFNALSLLAAGVAHEIGNPLNGLSLNLQLLKRIIAKSPKTSGIKKAGTLLENAQNEVDRLDIIIQEFLQAIRPVSLTLKYLNLELIVDETLELVRKEFSDRNITVKSCWPVEKVQVKGDANRLKQAFYNVIRNASQAMPEGGVLRIKCEKKDGYTELSFIDTGTGIPSENIGRIFDPYFTTRKEGSGLGLMVVQKIIREHGGTLSVESRQGAGASFIIRFPSDTRQVRLLPVSE